MRAFSFLARSTQNNENVKDWKQGRKFTKKQEGQQEKRQRKNKTDKTQGAAMKKGEWELKWGIIKRETVVQNLKLQFGILQPWYLDEERGTTDFHLPETVRPVSVCVTALLPSPPSLWSASLFMVHKWNLCHMAGRTSSLYLGNQP